MVDVSIRRHEYPLTRKLFFFSFARFMDRLRTTMNVTGDAMVSGMVAHLCPLDDTDTEEEGNEKVLVEEEDSEEAAKDYTNSGAFSVEA